MASNVVKHSRAAQLQLQAQGVLMPSLHRIQVCRNLLQRWPLAAACHGATHAPARWRVGGDQE